MFTPGPRPATAPDNGVDLVVVGAGGKAERQPPIVRYHATRDIAHFTDYLHLITVANLTCAK
jgi:hypothetical protein